MVFCLRKKLTISELKSKYCKEIWNRFVQHWQTLQRHLSFSLLFLQQTPAAELQGLFSSTGIVGLLLFCSCFLGVRDLRGMLWVICISKFTSISCRALVLHFYYSKIYPGRRFKIAEGSTGEPRQVTFCPQSKYCILWNWCLAILDDPG